MKGNEAGCPQTRVQAKRLRAIARSIAAFVLIVMMLHLYSLARFVNLMAPIPAWPLDSNGDSNNEIVARSKRASCFLLGQPELSRRFVIASYEEVMYLGLKAHDPEKLYILLRVLFDVPEAQPIKEAAIFAGWIGEGSPFPPRETDFVDLLWPLEYQQGQLKLRELGTLSNYSAPYNGYGEYKYFSDYFPLRSKEQLGCDR